MAIKLPSEKEIVERLKVLDEERKSLKALLRAVKAKDASEGSDSKPE